jgi:hypothetical protein
MSAGKKRGRDGGNDNAEVKQPDKKRTRTQKREIPLDPFELALRTGELYPVLHSRLKQLNLKQVFSIASRVCSTKHRLRAASIRGQLVRNTVHQPR